MSSVRARVVPWVALGLLGGSGLVGVGAWRVQDSALEDLRRATEVQNAEVPESDSKPPDLGQYKAILDTLDESIDIRSDIDGRLATLEKLVRSFDSRRKDAEEITGSGKVQLVAIGKTLGGAVGAARTSVSRLHALGDRIAESAELARLIALELEELDHSFGPTLESPGLPGLDIKP